MNHKQIIYGDYVFTPIKNAFNNKTSYWISKKDHTLAVYASTPWDNKSLEDMRSAESLKAYISYYESVLAKLK